MHTLASVPRILVPAFEPLESWAWPDDDPGKLAWLDHALAPPEADDAAAVESWSEVLATSPQFRGLQKVHFDTVGFKMSVGSVGDREGLRHVLGDRKPRLVFLERRNRIKHALSLYRAHEEDKDQFSLEGAQPPSLVDMARFDRWLEHSEKIHTESAAFRASCAESLGDVNVATVAYEDFADDEGKRVTLARLAAFVGFDVRKVTPSPYRKVTDDDLRRAVVNFDDFFARYAAGPHAGDF